MQKQGKIVRWIDDKGFGFIEPAKGGKQVFAHIKSFPAGSGRPAPGMIVSYSESVDAQGRLSAVNIRLPGPMRGMGAASKAFFVAAAFLLAIAAMVWLEILPAYFLWFYLAMSTLTFCFYAADKSAAKNDRQRTPEDTLHFLALVGGWPGAMYAQQLLRHKSSKQRFRLVFWLTVALNIGALGYLLTPQGAWLRVVIDNFVS
ncbi:MAG: cold shock and DUF1294 domain-containing protein [Moraxellaceae bacterium]|nr:cold shock and DUF1294 domain-containing protein [Moraxellaceae bacterium]